MAPFSPLPPPYSPHSRSLRPPQPNRPFAHIFGQAKPRVKRYKSASQVLCGCSTESKNWMLGLGLMCIAVVGWIASLPGGEALSRGVLVELHLETDHMTAAWDVTGPKGVNLDRVDEEVVSPYAPGEIELGKKRKIVFGHPTPGAIDPFDVTVTPAPESDRPSEPSGADEQIPTPQDMDDRGLDRPQPSPSPWASVEPMSAEEEVSSKGNRPSGPKETSVGEEQGSPKDEASQGQGAGKGEAPEMSPRRPRLGRRSRFRTKRR